MDVRLSGLAMAMAPVTKAINLRIESTNQLMQASVPKDMQVCSLTAANMARSLLGYRLCVWIYLL